MAAETDVTGQVSMLDGYIDRGVNGLIYAATDATALLPVTAKAQSAHIPVYNIDSGTTPQQVPLFAADNLQGAHEVAALMNTYLHGHGNVAIVEFQPGSMTDDQRKQGFIQGVAAYPGLHLVADQADGSDASRALTVTNDILTANPGLNGIFGSNEPSVIGASQAVKQRHLSGKIVMVGWDAAPDEVAALKSGEISALIVQNPFRMGFDSVVAMTEHIRNGVSVGNSDTGVYVVTKQNMNQQAFSAILSPSCTNPPLPSGARTPGFGAQMRPASIRRYTYPTGAAWAGAKENPRNRKCHYRSFGRNSEDIPGSRTTAKPWAAVALAGGRRCRPRPQ